MSVRTGRIVISAGTVTAVYSCLFTGRSVCSNRCIDIESYKKPVMRFVRLFNNACGEQISEQIGGEQITVLIYSVFCFHAIRNIPKHIDYVVSRQP